MNNIDATRSGLKLGKVSVVIPVYNEGALVQTLYSRLYTVLSEVVDAYEIIVVDDGSTDDTFAHLLTLHKQNPDLKIMRLARNFGHQTAIATGLQRASGEIVAVMDGDLQDPPELLPSLIAKLEEGYDVVYAVRTHRPEGLIKRTAYRLFYRILRWVARIDIPLDTGDFCVMRGRVVRVLNSLPERNRFIRGLRSWVGFRQVGLPCSRDERAGGTPKYTLAKLMRLSLDGIINFSDFPLRLASYFGVLVSIASFVGIGVVLYFRLFTEASIPGFASLAILILFIGGVQLLTIGVVGEYLGRIFDEVKQRPLYVVEHLVGWAPEETEAEMYSKTTFAKHE
jgi:polyisoprenyl-phosphate glycosyltransferase